jgi:capsular polysaccharide biosynthesis protein
MNTSHEPPKSIPVGRRVHGALAPLLPSVVRFHLLGLHSSEVRGDPAGRIPGYYAEPTATGALHHLPQGIAWGRGAHLDPRYRLIHALSPGINEGMDYWIRKRGRALPKVERLGRETVSLVSDGHGNYYHWMLDVLPRLAVLDLESLPQRHFLVSQESPFHRQTLDFLHIPTSSRTAVISQQFYTAPKFLIPMVRLGVSPENVRFVRHLLLERTGLERSPSTNERIYISRRYATSRRVLNEEELGSILKKHHFRICYLEQLSLKQQILLFHHAAVIMAPHGAAWTNLIFARPGALALEIAPKGLEVARSGAYHLYERLAATAGVGYERVTALISGSSQPHAADLYLDPAEFEKTLQRLE